MKVRVFNSSVGSSWIPSPASPGLVGTATWHHPTHPSCDSRLGSSPCPPPLEQHPKGSQALDLLSLLQRHPGWDGDAGQALIPSFPPSPNVSAASADLRGSRERFTSSLLIMQPGKKGQLFFPRPLRARDNPRRDLAAPNRGFSAGQCFPAPLLERGCSPSIKAPTEAPGWALHKSVPFNPSLPTVCKLGEA